MQILIIGAGGREHALGWKIAQNQNVKTVFIAPGNAGTALEPKLKNIDIDVEDISALVKFSKEREVALTIVGPEAPLVIGVVDAFREAGLKIFGPTEAAAQLEGSKSFAKDFLIRHAIPTGDYAKFSEIEAALSYVRRQSLPIVVKADGLAAGKGVVVAKTFGEAENFIKGIFLENTFGKIEKKVVIEEFLEGEETSFIVITDGSYALPMATSQDYKRVGDKDIGANTGGMGSCSPDPVITPEIYDRILKKIIYPTIHGMKEEGHLYSGFLYAGLIIDANGMPKVIEYNCRLGDPETQAVMLRMKSDFLELCFAAVNRKLDKVKLKWDTRASVSVILAANGYPQNYVKGDIISLPEVKDKQCKLFHAGTANDAFGKIVTNGGRVLCATALGSTIYDAQKFAYSLANKVSWKGMFYRNDIGYRAILHEREKKEGS
ncbi:phosphoribosylamine-glycine ligase [Candidatus Photodesmus blepharus]|uniref:Phosphoribosylamine--glycine ligase n=1 Tax=Candidatus Photodesmus blepharonis TaxID=1179155 RepID=A0A084CPA2_9GAMM|nr:phosphoribosylamine--glycine ligase [Candidatus Photodesmus blepharus]KEY91631.1 phosphoribosylamine-glycine ligase [Candidatus Photodesmus blepharus]